MFGLSVRGETFVGRHAPKVARVFRAPGGRRVRLEHGRHVDRHEDVQGRGTYLFLR